MKSNIWWHSIPEQRRSRSIPLWLPTESGFCYCWFDASDSDVITHSSGQVTGWEDKGSKGYDLANLTGSNRFTTNSATQNGLNVLVAENADLMTNGTQTDADNFSHIAVIKPTTTITLHAESNLGTAMRSGQHYLISPTEEAWTAGGFGWSIGSNGQGMTANSVAAGPIYVTPPFSLDTFTLSGYHIVMAETLNQYTDFWVDGTFAHTHGYTAYGTLTSKVGLGNVSGHGGFVGEIAEVIILNSRQSTWNAVGEHDLRSYIEGYLAWKWGLVSLLPATHMFKNLPPYTWNQ